jgi:hypothetical protein
MGDIFNASLCACPRASLVAVQRRKNWRIRAGTGRFSMASGPTV